MPQDRFKSAIYKSLIICDDPKGVVECGSIRKLKNAAQQTEHRGDIVKVVKNSNKSLTQNSNKTEAGEMGSELVREGNHSLSTSQLLEIAKGAQRLNQMIDSWSKGLSASSQPKYIGKDLLKGALDLQESLNVLARLQEASKYVGKSNESQNISERRSSEKLAIERTDSNRYRDPVYSAFDRPRLSTDDSSQRCADDLKELIRNSLSRKNILEEKSSKQYCSNQRNVESTSEIPSTSSSHSSTAHTDIFGSIDSSSSSVVPHNMIDSPNLIARLMGLEELASEQCQTSFQKQWGSERVFNRQNPVVDDDIPKLRESYHGASKVDLEMRTSRQTPEKFPCEGVVKDNLSKRLKHHSHKPSNHCSEEKLRSEGSQIVLLKPRHVAGTESRGSLGPSLVDKETFGTRNTVKKQIMKGRPANEGAYLRDLMLPTRKTEKLDAYETPESFRDKLVVKKTFIKRLCPDEKTCNFKYSPNKPVSRDVTAMEQAPNKLKTSGRIIHYSQESFVNAKRGAKIQKETVTSKKASEKDMLKSKYVSGPQDRYKSSSSKQRKIEVGSKIPSNQTSSCHTTPPNSISKSITARHYSSAQRKNQRKSDKPVGQSTAAISTTDNLLFKNCDKRIDCTPDNHINPTIFAERVRQEIPTEKIGSTEIGIEEHGCEDHELNSPCNDLLEIVGNRRDSDSNEAAEILVTQIIEYDKETKSRSFLKSLLLSSPSLHSHDEYFDAQMKSPCMSQAAGNKDCGITSDRVLLEYANELAKDRNLPDAYIDNPLSLSQLYSLKKSIYTDQLLQEFCNGIVFLKSFCKLLGEDVHVDGVYAMLEKDMMSKDAVNGNWDSGWRNGFSVGDAEEVVVRLETLLLDELIEEISI